MTSAYSNGHIILKQRPGKDGDPQESNFDYSDIPYPSSPLSTGQLLVKNLLLSVDPALRCRMNEESGAEYMKAWELGTTLKGVGGVGEVVESSDSNFAAGDIVIPTFEWPWSKYFIISSTGVQKPPEELSAVDPKLFLSLLGLTGLTAYLGIMEKGHITKGCNQVVVVTAAAGSTGMIAGQVAKAEGCGLLIGISGSDAKCKTITEELGFDEAINYKKENVSERLKTICPKGVDVYFDNVGGDISNTVIKQVDNIHTIPHLSPLSLFRCILYWERFLVLNYREKFTTSLSKLMELYVSGKLKVKETVECGLEKTPRAFVSMMSGGNIGKQIVQVAESL